MNNFSKLGLSAGVVEVLDQMGFENPTPVQQQAIPMLLENNPTDFIGLAQTGTGKTAAFGLPLIELIDVDNRATQALIMAPTRELGQQTAAQLKEFTKNNKKLNVEVVYGGANISNQIKALKKPTQIIVATPGRLLDLIKRKAVSLTNVKYVVLDEADEMLNMGFKEDIDDILSHTLEDRVTWLFSATMPKEIRRIIKKYMDAPLEVAINAEQKSNTDITHQYVVTKGSNKVSALRRFMDLQPEMRAILFCRTKRETQQIADDLGNLGYGVEALHGDLSQAQRDAVMKRFKTRAMQMLVATDVAARGIDVNDLTHVMHHQLPDQLESYTHRSGRTGRAGKKGISLAFINPREGRRITELEKRIKVTFQKVEVPSFEELKASRISNWANLILNTEVDEQANEILYSLHGKFAHLSENDLLKRLITTQLDNLLIQGGNEGDLNELQGGRNRDSDNGNRRDRRDRGERRESNFDGGGNNRYFINIGTIDGMTIPDFVHYVSDTAGIKRGDVGDISMQKTSTFFDVDSDAAKGFEEKFSGLEIEGRSIRVNRDDEGPKRSSRGGNGGGSSYKGGGRKRSGGRGDSRGPKRDYRGSRGGSSRGGRR
ncbi:MAG: DEAD/DEAH box helicase [Cyclobacteriaceae bacterium]|nr:DEAD/DEAH box helicase [Cyclobacteriaceae bacterium]